MYRKETFADKLMNRAFDLPAPEITDFNQLEQENSVVELVFEQLDDLAAAGQTEILISKQFAEKR